MSCTALQQLIVFLLFQQQETTSRAARSVPACGHPRRVGSVCTCACSSPVLITKTLPTLRRKGATFFNKRARGLLQAARIWMLAVEDPNDPDNDLARGSYNINRVRQAFDFAYTQVHAHPVLA